MRSSPPCSFGFRPWFACFAVFLLVLSCPGASAGVQKCPAFGSTFIQLWDRHEQWPQERWDRLCADLAELGVREIVLQWSLRTEPAFFWRLTPERRWDVPCDRVDPALAVERVVCAARRHGQKVRFGLTEDPAWWTEIHNEASLVEVFLNRLLQDQVALARTLAAVYGQDEVFAGFYLPQEVDDASWLDPARRACLEAHLTRLGAVLREIRPETSLAISCFATGGNDPRGFAELMASLARTGGIESVLYQDGLGTGRLRFSESAAYLETLVPTVAAAGGRVQVVVETFAPASQGQGFVPAAMNRVAAQLKQAYVLSGVDSVAFSLPDYVHPLAGPDAERLFRDYRAYLRGNR